MEDSASNSILSLSGVNQICNIVGGETKAVDLVVLVVEADQSPCKLSRHLVPAVVEVAWPIHDCYYTIAKTDTVKIQGFDSRVPYIHETVLKNECFDYEKFDSDYYSNSNGNWYVPGYKKDLVRIVEPLIEKKPLKPWITLKRNLMNIKYLSSMVDISFKNRHLYSEMLKLEAMVLV